MRSHIVEVMRLPAVDLPVWERNFKVTGEKLTHVCSVSRLPTHRRFLFFALEDESDGSATIWRTSTEGELLDTVRFFNGVAVRVPNELERQQFLSEQTYFMSNLPLQWQSVALDKPDRGERFNSELMLIASSPWVRSPGRSRSGLGATAEQACNQALP